MTVHNFKFDLEKDHIPLFLGKGGKNFFTKVVIGSIKAFKELKDEIKNLNAFLCLPHAEMHGSD